MTTEMAKNWDKDKDFLLSLGVDAGDAMQAAWDSESRKSPYSTVCDPEDETCEACGDGPTGRGCSECADFDEYAAEMAAS